MRPIKLTMSAFLSYGEEQVIDFNELGESGLYLISGETGAGKTTIFDAVMFALYGEASGDLRGGTMFRSKYAGPERATFVELLFECNGKQYRVKRNPIYERMARRGGGTVEESANAELEYFDGRPVVTGLKIVTAAVEEIIGLTRDQFSQIAMIAQGQFRDLLLADTKDRQTIFRRIFATENYSRLQDTVSRECRALSGDAENVRRAIDQFIGGIVTEEADGTEFPKGLSGDADILEERILAPLNALIEKDAANYGRITEEQRALDTRKTAAAQNVEKARQYGKNVKAKAEKETRAAENREKLTAAGEELAEARKAEPRIGELREKFAVENDKLGDYDTLDTLMQDQNKAKFEQGEKTGEKESITAEKERLEKLLQRDEEAQKTYSDADRKLAEAIAERDNVTAKADKCAAVIGRFEELEKKKRAVRKALEDADKKNQEAQRQANEASGLRARYLREQAGILAKDLAEGQKCPVCGSIHHPEPAVLSDGAVTKEAMEKAQSDSDALAGQAAEAATYFSSLKADMEAYEKETGNQAKELASGEDLLSAVKALQKELACTGKKLDADILSLKKAAERKAELEKTIPRTRKAKEEKERRVSELSAELTGLAERISGLGNQISDLRAKLEFPDRAAAQKHLRELQEEEKKLQDRIDRARKASEELKAEGDRLSGELEQLKSAIESSEKLDLAEQQDILDKLQQSIEEKDGLLRRLNTKLSGNRTARDRILEKKEEMAELYKRLVWLKALDHTISGVNIDNNGRLTLETYIQQAYFDRIVAKANLRFERMSQGHYSMARMTERVNNQAQYGLDLEVIDHYNGSRRTVKSLSGGEQFEASLSLALGLSDMVQEMSAGLKLDCMFIDEGFGSLDDDTLKLALNALKALSDGNRLVGIISHVNELKREIEDKIEVTKDARGFSHAKVYSGRL